MVNALKKWVVLSIGIVFHFSFLFSIFDIYFVSPLVHGMRHFSSMAGPQTDVDHTVVKHANVPAKRLFLIVGDGLRADKCFEKVFHPQLKEQLYLAPFIRSKALNDGTFGISHTRMPTESRPGHVAMIAGFYEDVSAVTKGWQENPVNFDSVFNQSRHTWSWGSPDILPMFSKGAQEGLVDSVTYDHAFEDFTKSSIELDTFVFDHITDMFKKAMSNDDEELARKLRDDKIIFFLHLLGIDTAGHGYRPYSAEYYDNIRYIDRKIAELEVLVNEFYGNDNETAWVFTADHGMSDFGSHGDGHPDNTRTPLVAWGAGVNPPIKDSTMGHDLTTQDWELPVARFDVNQADITSLMAYLIGANFPANSVGELPLDYLRGSPDLKARALASNAYTIAEQYVVKESQLRRTQMRFRPFYPLSGSRTVARRRAIIEEHIKNRNLGSAVAEAEDLMQTSLAGLRYLQTYNWLLLRALVTLGFLGWIAYSFTSFLWLFIVPDEAKRKAQPRTWVTPVSLALFSVISALMYRQKSPWNYYLYGFFPILFWAIVLHNFDTVKCGVKILFESSDGSSRGSGSNAAGDVQPSTSKPGEPRNTRHRGVFTKLLLVVMGLIIIECVVCGYFHREIFSVLLTLVFCPMPWFHHGFAFSRKHWPFILLWSGSCLALAICTIQPVVKVENLDMITGSGIVMFLVALIYTLHLNRVLKLSGITMVTCGFQLGLILLAIVVTRSSVTSLQARTGLPLGSQLVGWLTLIFSLLSPFMHSLAPVTDHRFQFLTIFMVLCPTMIILTISYEGYFHIAYSLLLYSWFNLEGLAKDASCKHLRLEDFRLPLMFMFFSHIGFFGTGNIASISSFSLDSVYRLIPIFNPFTMGALLIHKLLVPFIILSVALGIVNKALLFPSYAIFSMVLALCDILALNFFYLVVDEGSWLDIGTGISHFCICSLLCLFNIFLEYLGSLLVGESVTIDSFLCPSEPATTKAKQDTVTSPT